MNSLKAIIIDDEEHARMALAAQLNQRAPEIEIVAQCSNVPDGVLAINKNQPDIVFLDVEMPDYNGFELVEFFKEISFEIVFVTAYSQYAIRAFEISAIDYILKPVDGDDLHAAIAKVKRKYGNTSRMQRLHLMKEAYSGSEIQRIALPMSDGLLFVETENIIMFEADRVYTNVYMVDGSKILVSKPLRVFEDMLIDRETFFRPHRSFLINMRYLRKYVKGESIIELDNNLSLTISRDRKAEFEKLLRNLKMAF